MAILHEPGALPPSSETTRLLLNNISYQNSTNVNHSGYFSDDVDNDDDGSGASSNIIIGKSWNDSLFDCFRFGLFHPTLWNALCCPQILMGQVLTRLNMTWFGDDDRYGFYHIQQPKSNNNNIYFIPNNSNGAAAAVAAAVGTPSCSSRHVQRISALPISSSSSTLLHNNCWTRRSTFTQIWIIVCLYWVLTTGLAPPKVTDEKGHDVILVPTLMIPKSSYLHGSNSSNVTSAIGAQPMIVPQESKKDKKKKKDDDDDDESKELKELHKMGKFLYNTINWIFGLYTLIVLTKLRRSIRRKYNIYSGAALDGLGEDICISFWCGCCSIAQMARQTQHYHHDDENEAMASCCSPTGLYMPKLMKRSRRGSNNYVSIHHNHQHRDMNSTNSNTRGINQQFVDNTSGNRQQHDAGMVAAAMVPKVSSKYTETVVLTV